MPTITFDDVIDQAIAQADKPELAAGLVMVRYLADARIRSVINRWLSLQLRSEIDRRAKR